HAHRSSAVSTLSLHDALPISISRGQILLGKFVGHGLILALAVLICFGCAAVAIGALVEDIELNLLVWAFGRFMLSSTLLGWAFLDRKSTRLNSSHVKISYAVF